MAEAPALPEVITKVLANVRITLNKSDDFQERMAYISPHCHVVRYWIAKLSQDEQAATWQAVRDYYEQRLYPSELQTDDERLLFRAHLAYVLNPPRGLL